MKANRVLLFLLVCGLGLLVFSGTALATKNQSVGNVQPIVSTSWLAGNLGKPGLVVVDIRTPDPLIPGSGYPAGHIPGAISLPLDTNWAVNLPGPTAGPPPHTELPSKEALFITLGANGITPSSTVVVVGDTAELLPSPPKPLYGNLADTTRVATTLIYAGVKKVAVLEGGYPKWAEEGRPTDTVVPHVEPVEYESEVLDEAFVDMGYVETQAVPGGSSIIIDARDLDPDYAGGHIPTALSLPAASIWESDRTYKSTGKLRGMALDVIGPFKRTEVIVYCGVGGYASSWWFVLTQVLGYQNVKIYDGSWEEWAPNHPA